MDVCSNLEVTLAAIRPTFVFAEHRLIFLYKNSNLITRVLYQPATTVSFQLNFGLYVKMNSVYVVFVSSFSFLKKSWLTMDTIQTPFLCVHYLINASQKNK